MIDSQLENGEIRFPLNALEDRNIRGDRVRSSILWIVQGLKNNLRYPECHQLMSVQKEVKHRKIINPALSKT